MLTWSFQRDKRQRASRACEVSSMPLLYFGWNLGCAVGSLDPVRGSRGDCDRVAYRASAHPRTEYLEDSQR